MGRFTLMLPPDGDSACVLRRAPDDGAAGRAVESKAGSSRRPLGHERLQT